METNGEWHPNSINGQPIRQGAKLSERYRNRFIGYSELIERLSKEENVGP